jgi:hypothetical protein
METIGLLAIAKDVYCPLNKHRRFTAILSTSDTINAEIQQAQDASGTGTKAIPGLALDETGAGVYIISGQIGLLDASQIPGSEFDHVAIVVTSGTVTVIAFIAEEPLELPPYSVAAIVKEVVI